MKISSKNTAIIGAAFGDEGKAIITNRFAKDYEVVVRVAGSSNAGHTFYYKGKKIVRHLIPSADFSILNQLAFLGAGMVINPAELLQEVQETEAMFPGSAQRIIVDPEAFLITPEHLVEDQQNVKAFGSTGKGVGVAYRDKVYRKGTRLQSLVQDNNEVILALKKLGVQFKFNLEMYDLFSKCPILFEGAQSVMLDISHGTYPYVTSSDCAIGGVLNSGFAYALPSKIYGICKAYSTRVGDGPFPTELFGEASEFLRAVGDEYGATTKRPRRVGWLDLPMLRYAIAKAGINSLIVTKLDILNGMKEIPVCNSYQKEPVCAQDFFMAKPNYLNLKGWVDCKNFVSDMTDPKFASIYSFIQKIEAETKVQVEYVSCGVDDEDFYKL